MLRAVAPGALTTYLSTYGSIDDFFVSALHQDECGTPHFTPNCVSLYAGRRCAMSGLGVSGVCVAPPLLYPRTWPKRLRVHRRANGLPQVNNNEQESIRDEIRLHLSKTVCCGSASFEQPAPPVCFTARSSLAPGKSARGLCHVTGLGPTSFLSKLKRRTKSVFPPPHHTPPTRSLPTNTIASHLRSFVAIVLPSLPLPGRPLETKLRARDSLTRRCTVLP